MRRFLGRRFSAGGLLEGNGSAEQGEEAAQPASSTLRAAAQLVLGGGPVAPPIPPERKSAAEVLESQREHASSSSRAPLPERGNFHKDRASFHSERGSLQPAEVEPQVDEDEEGLTAYPKAVEMKDPRQGMSTDIGVVGFSHPGHDEAWDVHCGAGFLSNFYDLGSNSLPVEVPNAPGEQFWFLSAEAAFQALRHWERAKEFQHLSAGDAWRLNRHLSGQEDWTYAGFGSAWEGMASVLRTKFAPGTALARALLTTEDSFLLHHNIADFKDALWSDNGDGEGKNLLGMQLMLIRDELSGQYTWTDFIRRRCGVNLQTGEIPDTEEEEPWQETVRIARVALVSKLPVTKSTVAKVRAVMQKENSVLEEDAGQLLSRGELALIRMLTTPGNRLSMMLNDLASKDDEEGEAQGTFPPEGEASMSGGDVLQPLPQFEKSTRAGSAAEARKKSPMFLPRAPTTSDLEARRAAAEKNAAEAEKVPPEPPVGKEVSIGSRFPLQLATAEEPKENVEERGTIVTEASKHLRFKRGGDRRDSQASSVARSSFDEKGSPDRAVSLFNTGKRASVASVASAHSAFGSVWSDIPDWENLRKELPPGKAELNERGRMPALLSALFWIVVAVAQLLANFTVYSLNEVPDQQKIVVDTAVQASKNYALEVLLPAIELAQTLDVAMRMGHIESLSDYEGLIHLLQPHFEGMSALKEVEIVDVRPTPVQRSSNLTQPNYDSIVDGELVPRSFLMHLLANGSTQVSSDREDCGLIPGRRGCSVEPLGANGSAWFRRGLALDPALNVVEMLPAVWLGPLVIEERDHLESCGTFCWRRGISLVTRVFRNTTDSLAASAPVLRVSLTVEPLLPALARIEEISKGTALICTNEGAVLAALDMASTVWVDTFSGVVRNADTWEYASDWAKSVSADMAAGASGSMTMHANHRVSVWPLDSPDRGAASLGSTLRLVVAIPRDEFTDSILGAIGVPTVVVAGLPVLAAVLLTIRGMYKRCWRRRGRKDALESHALTRTSRFDEKSPVMRLAR
mmetsp:Transcript_65257/g.121659  ORF Transcript_65257/g.121659 Transcript_65257/m.121659 type:complete len:1026 (-) Transcript_65257:166-3243(-)